MPALASKDRARLAWAFHLACLGGALAVLLYLARNIWFVYDEWEFIAGRLVVGPLALFQPHNEHWSTVPLLLYDALFHVFGARTHVPYMALIIVLHLAIAHVVWRLMRRAGAGEVVAALLALLFLLLGAGHDNVLWAFQIGFDLSILLGLLQALAADHPGPLGGRDVAGWAAGITALASSGLGLPMLALTGMVALLRRGTRSAALAMLPPLLAYAVWFAAVGKHGVSGEKTSLDAVLHIPAYIWTGLTTSVDLTTGWAGAGAVVVAGLVVWVATRRWPLDRTLILPVCAAATTVVLFGIIGTARLDVTGQAVPPRYIHPTMALLLPAIAVALTGLAVGRPLLRWVAAGVIALVVVNGVGVMRAKAAFWNQTTGASRDRILGAAQLIESGAQVVGDQPDPNGAPDVTTAALQDMLRNGQIKPAAARTEAIALDVESLMQVRLGPEARLPSDPARLRLGDLGDATLSPASPGCVRLDPRGASPHLQLTVLQPADLTITPDATGTLTVQVPGTSPRTFPLAAGQAAHLDVANRQLSPLVGLSGAAVICGAAT